MACSAPPYGLRYAAHCLPRAHAQQHRRDSNRNRMKVGGHVTCDQKAVEGLIQLPVENPRLMLADKGYDSDDVRTALLMKGGVPIIPPKSNRREPIACDFRAYNDRNRVETMFNQTKQFRRIATRYNKTAVSYMGFLTLASIKLWMPAFGNTTWLATRRHTALSLGGAVQPMCLHDVVDEHPCQHCRDENH